MNEKLCQLFAKILISKGLAAYSGNTWDACHDHKEPGNFWFFWPCGNDLGIHSEYDGGTYDTGIVEIPNLARTLHKLHFLKQYPTRDEVWAILDSDP